MLMQHRQAGLQCQTGWHTEAMGTSGHRSPHLKVLYQRCIQLKMFTIFREGQQIKLLHTLPRILNSLPQHSLAQQCGQSGRHHNKHLRRALETYKPVSGSNPGQCAAALGRRSPCQACWTVSLNQEARPSP